MLDHMSGGRIITGFVRGIGSEYFSNSVNPTFSHERLLPGTYPNRYERHMRCVNNNRIASNTLDAWSYQWVFANASQSRLAVVPRRNLIVNIGFGEDATHTTFRNPVAPGTAEDIRLPTRPPEFVLPDHVYDHSLSRLLYPGRLRAKLTAVTSRLSDPAFVRAKLRRLLQIGRKV